MLARTRWQLRFVEACNGSYAALMGLLQIPERLRCSIHGMVSTDPRQLVPVYCCGIDAARKQHSPACRIGKRVANAARLLARDPAARPVTP